MNYEEFVQFMFLCRHGTLEDKLTLLFQFYDRDGSGTITSEEMMSTYVVCNGLAGGIQRLEKLNSHHMETKSILAGMRSEEKDTSAGILRLVKKYDYDKSGSLSLEEFIVMMKDPEAMHLREFFAAVLDATLDLFKTQSETAMEGHFEQHHSTVNVINQSEHLLDEMHNRGSHTAGGIAHSGTGGGARISKA
jgi:Ca2+-binding EF-hand superfamily protein